LHSLLHAGLARRTNIAISLTTKVKECKGLIATVETVRSSGRMNRGLKRTVQSARGTRQRASLLLPFKHVYLGLTSAHGLPGHGQGLEVGREFDLLGVIDFAVAPLVR
jgi:hypothetical protein